jgi:hypothetical protein
MSEEKTIEQSASEGIADILAFGQSVSQSDMQVSRASLRDSYSILTHEANRQARRAGRRPLFRSLNISGVS